MDKPGLIDLMIAPLTWLERSKGWKRGGLFVFYVSFVLVVGILAYRELSLWRLPDIGEPFNLAKFGTVELADVDNAAILYRQANKQLILSTGGTYQAVQAKAWEAVDWASADPEVRRWAEDNRPALGVWLKATEKPDSLFVQPAELRVTTQMGDVLALRNFARLAILEASRLEAAGDYATAWTLYGGVLRSSRHARRHGGALQRMIGQEMVTLSRSPIQRWVENSVVDSKMLRRAIIDFEACRSIASPASEMVQAEFFLQRSILESTDAWKHYRLEGPEGAANWTNQIEIIPKVRHFLAKEPERSLRILRLITAGILAQCDRPRQLRPQLAHPGFVIYEVDSQTPAALDLIPPTELIRWADRSAYSSVVGGLSHVLNRIDSESNTVDTFLLRMAERAFELDHSRLPKTYGEYLGAYLKSLPDGIEPGDLASASPDLP